MTRDTRAKRLMLIIDNLDIGGAQRLLEIQVAEMAASYRILVVNLAQETALSHRLRALGAEVVCVGLKRMTHLGHVLRLKRQLQEWKPDLIHSHLLHSTLIGAMVARGLDVPLVVTLHNETLDNGTTFAGVKSRIEQFVLSHRADVVIACGPRVGRVQYKRVGKTPLVTVANRIPPLDILSAQDKSQRRRDLGIAEGRVFIFAAGRLCTQKGYDVLLDAFAGLKQQEDEAVLWIAGGGENFDALQAQIARLGLQQRVQMLGPIADVDQKLLAADIFVLPSRHEGLPMVLLEAMSAGCAILATKVGDVETVMGENAGILVHPENVQELGDGLSRLISDKTLRETLGAKARLASLDYTDIDTIIVELESAYTSAFEHHAARH